MITLPRRILVPLCTLGGALALAACPQRAHVWLAPGASAPHLTFGIGRSVNKPGGVAIGVFRVDPCDKRDGSAPAWIAIDNTGTDTTGAIQYGQLPTGFSESRPAMPLAPGCYVASVSGSPGRIAFDVSATGAVRPDATER